MRSHEELQAALAAADAAVTLAEAEVRRIEAALEFSRERASSAREALARTEHDLLQGAWKRRSSTSRPTKRHWRAPRRSSTCGAASAPASRPG